MQNAKSSLLALIVLIVSTNLLHAQNDHAFKDLKFKTTDGIEQYIYEVKTSSESIFIGELLNIKGDKLILLTKEIGKIELKISNIKTILPFDPSNENASVEDNNTDGALKYHQLNGDRMVGSTHYFISTSAHTLEKGEGELQVAYIFFLSGTYGITENLSITGGTSILPLVSIGEQFFYLIPKVSFKIAPGVQLGGQAIFLTAFGENLTLASLATTLGTEEKNINFGLSYGYNDGELVRIPILNISGVLKISKSFALMTDNLILTDVNSEGDIFSFGCRIMTGSSAFDIGVFSIGGYSLPYFNYTLRF